jgi:hypothetical protein
MPREFYEVSVASVARMGADKDHLPMRLLLSPLPDPEVEYLLQIDVRRALADTSALNRPHLTRYSPAFFRHARVEPPLDQAYGAPVSCPMLDEPRVHT